MQTGSPLEGLSLVDNWVSIRDRDNNVSVRAGQQWITTCLSGGLGCPGLVFIPFTFCLYFSLTHSSLGNILLFCFLMYGLMSLSLMLFTVCTAPLCSASRPFQGDRSIHRVRTTERVVPVLKVSPCHQLIVTTHISHQTALLKGQTVSVKFLRLYTLTRVGS